MKKKKNHRQSIVIIIFGSLIAIVVLYLVIRNTIWVLPNKNIDFRVPICNIGEISNQIDQSLKSSYKVDKELIVTDCIILIDRETDNVKYGTMSIYDISSDNLYHICITNEDDILCYSISMLLTKDGVNIENGYRWKELLHYINNNSTDQLITVNKNDYNIYFYYQ